MSLVSKGTLRCPRATQAFSRACLGLALPGVQEREEMYGSVGGGRAGRGPEQSLKTLIATLTTIRSKESLLRSLIS